MSPTPLESVSPGLFLKREDLLPYGGGNKVRRFLHWLEGRAASRHVACLSDRGSHSFSVLARMRADDALPLEALTLYERSVPDDPYRTLRVQDYEGVEPIDVRRGAVPALLLRWWLGGLRRDATTARLRMGGRTPDADQAYAGVFDECVAQLAAAGVDEADVVHLFPVASGDMAHAFLRRIAERGLTRQRLVGVLTGPWAARAYARIRNARHSRLRLIRRHRMTWDEYVERAAACHAQTGVWLDPVHAIHTWDRLQRQPDVFQGATTVLWVTCMRGVDPRS